MRVSTLATALLLLALTAFAPQAAAAANGCALLNPGPPVPMPFIVVPGGALGQAACTVVGAVAPPGPVLPVQNGLSFVSGAPACPPLPFVGPLPGELCGPLVPGLATVTCSAAALGGGNPDLPNSLVIGLDYIVPLTADGNVVEVVPLDFEPLRYNTDFGIVSVSITNPLPVSARVIAYPVFDPAFGPVSVGCL